MLPRKIYQDYRVGFCFWILQVIIVLSLASVVVWLSLRPKCPTYTIVDAYIPALDVKSATSHENSETSRNNSLFFSLEIRNPNKGIGIYYDEINLSVYYGDAVIGLSSVFSFYQGHRKTARREVRLNADLQFLRDVSRAVSSQGSVDLRVGLAAAIRFKIFSSKTKHQNMELQANLQVGSDGKLVGENKKLLNTLEQPKAGH
ncbi:PREDICTED: protein NDR1-like [Nelumbo nucifera]|uniref:Late embryogenesis abundant protein LEA-2 subgroup domain-containing protein n=2 Tax=Nelumbo nucifera TaxID=4432 RepID=A0A822XJW6_NELNU|nr:PREDICTED: protein NDR1-like [Nelumbo nucifera]DAD20587.1 TPA_asm: hypothetical protein HUJ06_022050 [Nelumbo nucifera]